MNRRDFLSATVATALLPAARSRAQTLSDRPSWLGTPKAGDLVNLARYGELKSWLNPAAAFLSNHNSLSFAAAGSQENESDAGVEWPEFRTVNQIVLRFAGVAPDPGPVFLEFWEGLTALQGAWKGFESGLTNGDHLSIEGSQWTYRFTERRTCKIRLRIRRSLHAIRLQEFAVYGPSRWKQGEIRIEWGHQPKAPFSGRLETYNGELLQLNSIGTAKVHDSVAWTSSPGERAGVSATVLYAVGMDVDRSIITVRSKGNDCSFLPGEAIEGAPIDAPDFGLYVRSAASELDWAGFHARGKARSRIIELTAKHEEQTIHNAYANIRARRVSLSFVGTEANCHKFGIAPDGHFVVGNGDVLSGDPITPGFAVYFETAEAPLLFQSPSNPAPSFEQGNDSAWVVPKDQSLEEGWLPIVVTKWSQNDLYFERTDFASLLAKPQDLQSSVGTEPAVLISRLKILNRSPIRKLASYYMRPWKPESAKPFTYGPLPSAIRDTWSASLHQNAVIASDGSTEKTVCVVDTHGSGRLLVAPASNSVVYQLELSPGEEHTIHTVVPGWLPPAGAAASLQNLDYDALHAAASAHWVKRASSAMQIKVPEQRLQNLYDASLQHFLLALTQNGQKRECYPNTAMMHYGSIGTESSPIIRALDMRGLHDIAERCLEAFLSTQSAFIPDGDYASKEGGFYRFWPIYTCDQGGVLWALAEHYRYTRDRAWLQRTAPKILAGCDFIVRERKRTMHVGPDGKKPAHYGLAPAGCVADPRDWQYSFMLNAWFYAGLKNCAEILSDVDPSKAHELALESVDYRDCILRALQESVALSPVTRLRDNTSVSSVPPYIGLRGFSTDVKDSVDPDRRHGYAYDCTIGPFHLFNCGVLEPDDPIVTAMLNYLEDRFFLFTPLPSRVNLDQLGVDWFNLGGFEKLQPYYVHYQEAYLRRDQIPNFLRGFYNTLAPIADPQTLTFQEELDFGGGQPHKTHEEGWFFHQIRNMLVMESGKELHLARGTPRRWLEDGQEISVDKAATWFGPLSYRIHSSVSTGSITANVHFSPSVPPEKIFLRLRHPNALPMKSVEIAGKPWTDFDPAKEWIVLPPGAASLDLTAHF